MFKKTRARINGWYNIAMLKISVLYTKTKREVLKLSFAVVMCEFLIVCGWYVAEEKGLLEVFRPKTIIINNAMAKSHTLDEVNATKLVASSYAISDIVETIIMLESSGGKNNYSKCQAIGKYNRSGYGIHGGKWLCFDTKEEEEKTIAKWFETKLKTMTLEEALYVYCPENVNYISNFKKLIGGET